MDGSERIHLAREVNASTPLWNDGLRFFALVGGVGLVCKVVWFAAGPALWAAGIAKVLPTVALTIFGSLLLVAVGLGVFRRGVPKASLPGDPPKLPLHSDPSFRLRMVGSEHRLRAILSRRASNAAFEPLAIRLWLGHAREAPRPGRYDEFKPSNMGGLTLLHWVLAANLVGGVLVLAGMITRWHAVNLSFITVWAAIGLTALFATWIKPSYLRISPGRLDVLEFGPLGLGRVRCDTYNLRTAKILIGIDNGVARIEDSTRATDQIIHIHPGLITLGRFERLTRASDAVWVTLLEAATTNVPTPPLPEDALTG